MTAQRRFAALRRVSLYFVLFLCAVPTMAAAPFTIVATSDAIRVFEDGFGFSDRSTAELRLFGLRDEIISAQCVVRAQEELKDLTVSVGPFKSGSGPSIPPENVQWNFVQSVYIEKNTPTIHTANLVRTAPAAFPDCLSDVRSCAVHKGALKAIYVTIRIPRHAEAGEHRAEITASVGGIKVSLPVVVTVYPLVLPEDRHLMVAEWHSARRVQGNREGERSEKALPVLRAYAKNMAEHRQNVFLLRLDLIESKRTANGELRFDFGQFDQCAQVFWDTGRMDRLETGFVAHPGKGGWFSREIVLSEFSVKDEAANAMTKVAGKDFLPQFLPAFVKHLRGKGWLEKTLFHICDETANHNIMAWRDASEFVHRYAPELRRIDAIETPYCSGALEVWVPKLDHLVTWRSAYEEAQRQGNELWFYTVGIYQGGSFPNKTIDVPLIESRVMHWLNYRYGLKGYLHWGFNFWTDDPINAPGLHRGDGWHVYPGRDGVLNSLRWEQMRNGIEDYECLWLLEHKTAEIRATLAPRVAALIEPGRRGVEIASQVVRSYGEYTKDPAVLYAAKRQAIEAVIDLEAAPRCILQTNPPEHSAVEADCAIDIHGWVEPSTKLKINGQDVFVASDGLVLVHMNVSPQKTLVFDVESDKGHKTFVRHFDVISVRGQQGP